MYVDFLIRCLVFGVAGMYFPWNARGADLDGIWKCLHVYCSHKVGDIRTFKSVAPTKSIEYI